MASSVCDDLKEAKLRTQQDRQLEKQRKIMELKMKQEACQSELEAAEEECEADTPDMSKTTGGRKEGWLTIATKQDLQRYTWKKQYVVVSRKKVLFYVTQEDKLNHKPSRVIDLAELVAKKALKNEVCKEESNKVSRLIMIAYSKEKELILEQEDEMMCKLGVIEYKGHKFIKADCLIQFPCLICGGTISEIEPKVLDCTKCQVKIHEMHLQEEEAKGSLITCENKDFEYEICKELLILAPNQDDQEAWIGAFNKYKLELSVDNGSEVESNSKVKE